MNADRPGIREAYGTFFNDVMEHTAKQLSKAMEKHQPKSEMVADAALSLIDMPKGTRPLRTAIDPIAQGVEKEFNVTAAEIKKRWLGNYGL